MATVSELSKKYSSQLSQLQAIFPEWEEGDLVFALQDSKGNVEETVLAISEGKSPPLMLTCLGMSARGRSILTLVSSTASNSPRKQQTRLFKPIPTLHTCRPRVPVHPSYQEEGTQDYLDQGTRWPERRGMGQCRQLFRWSRWPQRRTRWAWWSGRWQRRS